MKRRAFLGFMGGAAAAGPSLAKAAADDVVLRQAGFPMGSKIASAAPAEFKQPSMGAVGKVVQWIRRAGIPEWKMREIKRTADHYRAYGIDPDLACLVSVSAGFKARTQRTRNIERQIDSSLAGIGSHVGRRDFGKDIHDRFGVDLDWYD